MELQMILSTIDLVLFERSENYSMKMKLEWSLWLILYTLFYSRLVNEPLFSRTHGARNVTIKITPDKRLCQIFAKLRITKELFNLLQ